MRDERQFLKFLFDRAVAAARPATLVPRQLARPPKGRTLVIGAGKAAASMARAVEDNWPATLSGLVVTPYGHSLACERIEVVEAAHPIPDTAGQDAARRMLEMVRDTCDEDLVLCLLSGGGSALLSMPADGIGLEDKQSITADLLKSGAHIAEINCVRKHLSAIKGGRLAVACSPAKLMTLAISDVPGNDISAIASGPTLADETTSNMALDILRKYDIAAPDSVLRWLEDPASETPKPHDPVFSRSSALILATADDAMIAAAQAARENHVEPLVLGDLAGDASVLAIEHAALAIRISAGTGPVRPPCVVISGGETTVKVRGRGKGGRNSEYALALAIALDAHPGIYAIACDTDGIDGTEDNAGCYVTPSSLQRAEIQSLDAKGLLESNDSYRFFSVTGDLVVTGPTRTNVNDFRAILIRAQVGPSDK
ncbi:MAG: glycerate kinase [Woeseiaceae bacterium]